MIEINNLTTVSIDESFLKKIAERVLRGEKIRKESELSIALVGQGVIRKLNKRYRNKNRVTDVLSFSESRTGVTNIDSKSLGEIVICLKEVKKNARRYKTNFKNEISRVLIHGILHLLGYDHEGSEKKVKIMENKEKFYLSEKF